MVATSAGSTMAIGDVGSLPATEDAAGYEALTLNDIGNIESLSVFGVEYNPVTFTPLAGRKVQKYKGSYDPGTITATLAITDDDDGQIAAEAGLAVDSDIAFSVTTQSGTVRYFSGKVMSFTTNISSVDSITMGDVQVAINTDIIKVLPTP